MAFIASCRRDQLVNVRGFDTGVKREWDTPPTRTMLAAFCFRGCEDDAM